MSAAVRFTAGCVAALVVRSAVPWGLASGSAGGIPPGPTPYDREGLSAADYAGLGAYDGRTSATDFDAAVAKLDPRGLLAPFVVRRDGAAELRDAAGEVRSRVALHGGAGTAEDPGRRALDAELRDGAGEARSRVAPGGASSATGSSDHEGGRALAGLRILLDPGHFGGAWSEVEHRHFVVDGGEPVREGTLAWGTVGLLRQDLEAAGVEVFLSRGAPPRQPFPSLSPSTDLVSESTLLAWLKAHLPDEPTTQWLAERPAQLERFWVDAQAAHVVGGNETFFEVFNRFDYRRRGLMAADLGADVTVSLHYNVSRGGIANRVAVFVPGAILPGEADSDAERFFAFRRAVEGDGDLVFDLALSISERLQDRMGLSGRQRPHGPDAPKLPLDLDNGVFARNLAVLRRATGPVLLVEGPCMNNAEENARLLRRDIEWEGQLYPRRTREYAESVLEGLRANASALWRHRARRGR